MDGLGKGIAIAASAGAVALAVWITRNPICLWAFVPIAWMACDWKTK